VAFTTHPRLLPSLWKELIYASTPFVACSKVNFSFTSFYDFFSAVSNLSFFPSIFLLYFLSRSSQSYFCLSFFLSFTSSSFKKNCLRLLSHNLFSRSVLICSDYRFIQSHEFSQVSARILGAKACTEDTQSWRQSS
jgi:hypothetical protein